MKKHYFMIRFTSQGEKNIQQISDPVKVGEEKLVEAENFADACNKIKIIYERRKEKTFDFLDATIR